MTPLDQADLNWKAREMDEIKNKPWVVLGMTRKQYCSSRPWSKTKMTRKDFENLISVLPPEIFDEIKLQADAEKLAEALFGPDAREE